eukprot:2437743-Amphidinium_carterae.1
MVPHHSDSQSHGSKKPTDDHVSLHESNVRSVTKVFLDCCKVTMYRSSTYRLVILTWPPIHEDEARIVSRNGHNTRGVQGWYSSLSESLPFLRWVSVAL